jgi:hypothetical protein
MSLHGELTQEEVPVQRPYFWLWRESTPRQHFPRLTCPAVILRDDSPLPVTLIGSTESSGSPSNEGDPDGARSWKHSYVLAVQARRKHLIYEDIFQSRQWE